MNTFIMQRFGHRPSSGISEIDGKIELLAKSNKVFLVSGVDTVLSESVYTVYR